MPSFTNRANHRPLYASEGEGDSTSRPRDFIQGPAPFRAAPQRSTRFSRASERRYVCMDEEPPMTKTERNVEVPIGDLRFAGTLGIPPGARGLVLFAHGSGSSRLSPRNVTVARGPHGGGLGAPPFDLFTAPG